MFTPSIARVKGIMADLAEGITTSVFDARGLDFRRDQIGPYIASPALLLAR